MKTSTAYSILGWLATSLAAVLATASVLKTGIPGLILTAGAIYIAIEAFIKSRKEKGYEEEIQL